MRLRRLRLAAFVALPVAMFIVGTAGGATTFVPHPGNPKTVYACKVAQSCGCTYQPGAYTTILAAGDTFKTVDPSTNGPSPLGYWECGGPSANPSGDMYSGPQCPAPPAGTTSIGKGYWNEGGCN
jgi:hypothetical protein